MLEYFVVNMQTVFDPIASARLILNLLVSPYHVQLSVD